MAPALAPQRMEVRRPVAPAVAARSPWAKINEAAGESLDSVKLNI